MAERTVKTTQIVKKWTDKKTGEKREITIDYSKVNDRLKQFWEDHPNGKVATDYKVSRMAWLYLSLGSGRTSWTT